MRWSLEWPWQRRPSEWETWYLGQVNAHQEGAEIVPPWVAFPEAEPWSPAAQPGPTKQGVYGDWLRLVFLSFWWQQSPDAQAAYLERWPAPRHAWRDYLEKMGRRRRIIAVEDRALREALLRGTQAQGLQAEFLEVAELGETELYGIAIIILNTGADLDRLFATANRLYKKWVVPHDASLWIRTYSPKCACPERQVTGLWAAGDPDSISPGVYEPARLGEVVREVTMYLSRIEGRF